MIPKSACSSWLRAPEGPSADDGPTGDPKRKGSSALIVQCDPLGYLEHELVALEHRLAVEAAQGEFAPLPLGLFHVEPADVVLTVEGDAKGGNKLILVAAGDCVDVPLLGQGS